MRGFLILQTLLQRALWKHSSEFASIFITLPIGLNYFQKSGSFCNSRGRHGSRTPKRTVLRLSWIELKLRLHRWRLYIWPLKPWLVFKHPTTMQCVSKFIEAIPIPHANYTYPTLYFSFSGGLWYDFFKRNNIT